MTILNITFDHRSIEVIKDVKEVYIYGYFNELTQALLNILNNAKDALEHIEGKRYIFLTIYEEKDSGIISIKDNAGGIPDNVKEHIFEPYFTTKHKSQGTGIGLYMTKQIVQKHMNGTIEFFNRNYEYEGTKYTGAEFIISLPLKKTDSSN